MYFFNSFFPPKAEILFSLLQTQLNLYFINLVHFIFPARLKNHPGIFPVIFIDTIISGTGLDLSRVSETCPCWAEFAIPLSTSLNLQFNIHIIFNSRRRADMQICSASCDLLPTRRTACAIECVMIFVGPHGRASLQIFH